MNDHVIVAAQIDWSGGLVQVTDSTLRIDAALLEDAQFEPRIIGSVNWAESARHPYQQQAGELVVGNLTLANADGGLDALATGDVVGAEVKLRRGSDADRWADLEFVFAARVSGVRLNGRSEIVLELENILADLAGPVFSDKFASTVPNPQLEGKDIPLVLGKVKQAPVLEFNPTTLTYYTAQNANKIGQVAEGANPTQRWTLEDQPTFNLLGSPLLPITADFEGPGPFSSNELAAIGEFSSWAAGEPVGWTVTADTNATYAEAVGGGIQITALPNPIFIPSTFASTLVSSNIDNLPDPVAWTIFDAAPPNGVWTGSVSLAINQRPEAILMDVFNAQPMHRTVSGSFEVTGSSSSTPALPVESITVRYGNGFEYRVPVVTTTEVTNGIRYRFAINPETVQDQWGGVEDITTTADDIVIRFGRGSGDYEITGTIISDFETVSGVKLDPSLTLTPGERVTIRVDAAAADFPDQNLVMRVGTIEGTTVYPNLAIPNSITELPPGGGIVEVSWPVTSEGTVGFYFVHPENSPASSHSQAIRSIALDRQAAANTSYKTLAPYILTTAGIDAALHLDQAAINAHATAAGDPDLGWLVNGDETVDQILFRLAGSLGGYVWHGLDGKVRSKRLELPTDPGGTPFVIDSSRADIDEISAYDDPAPQLTTRVNALRNWQPIPPDRQAGITSTWTESDRAAAAADWRITRVYAADANYKRRWAGVEAREPYSSALIDATAAQTLANQAGLWAQRPRFYEIPTEVLIGELADVAVGNVVRVELDYPGLNGVWMLVMGREGDARPGTVNLTLWG